MIGRALLQLLRRRFMPATHPLRRRLKPAVHHLRRRLKPATLVLPLLLVTCSNQGEGERCSLRGENGGNDECQGNLICTNSGLNGAVQGGYDGRCCPQDRTQATTTICQQAVSPAGGDAAVPPTPDSGLSDTGGPVPEGGADASVDSPLDSPIDAPPDVQPQDAADGGG
jgi:hypothetical protein